MAIFAFASCKKEKEVALPPIPANNKPPVANAGPDTSISLLTCRDITSIIQLDGSGSFDPDNNIVSYTWILIGSPGYVVKNQGLAKTSAENLAPGQHAFELTIKDAGGLSSKDTVVITVNKNPEYPLDIMINTAFTFLDNYNNPWEDPGYNDITTIRATATFFPLGELNISVYEYADTAELSDIHHTYIQISRGILNLLNVGGSSSVNFKKIIRERGGTFNGTFTIDSGTAQACDPNVFANLMPLTVTGNLNVNTGIVNLRIKGRTYF